MTKIGHFEVSGTRMGMVFAGVSLASLLVSKSLLNLSGKAGIGLSLSGGALAAAVASVRRDPLWLATQSVLERARRLEQRALGENQCVTTASPSSTLAGGPILQSQIGRAVRERLENSASAFYCEIEEEGLLTRTDAALIPVTDSRFVALCSAVLDTAEADTEIEQGSFAQRALLDRLVLVFLCPKRSVPTASYPDRQSYALVTIDEETRLTLFPTEGDDALGLITGGHSLDNNDRHIVIRETDVVHWLSKPT